MNLLDRGNLAIFVVGAAIGWAVPAPSIHAQTPPPGGYISLRIGLMGPGYEFTPPGEISFFNISATQMNANGLVVGQSTRFNESGNSLGEDAWLHHGASARAIGLVGAGFEYEVSWAGGGIHRRNVASDLNSFGQAVGFSQRFTASGQDIGSVAWFYDGLSTQSIPGLTGADYQYVDAGGVIVRSSSAHQLNDSGQVLGGSTRYSASGTIYLGSDPWFHDGTTTHQIGLTGSEYEYARAGGTYRLGGAEEINPTGKVFGYTERRNSARRYMGQDIWYFDGTSTQRIGMTGSEYEYAYSGEGGGTHRYTSAYGMNDAGKVIGRTYQYEPNTSTMVRSEAWLFDGTSSQAIGLGVNGPQNGAAGAAKYSNEAQLLNEPGQAGGNGGRRSANGASLGYDAWFYDGSSTQIIGLTGEGYEYAATEGAFRFGSVSQLNDAGHVAGESIRYNATGEQIGFDAWLFDGDTTQMIGLTGGQYERQYTGAGGGTQRNSRPYQMNAAGQVAGISDRYSDDPHELTTASWFFDPATNITTELSFNLDGVSGPIYAVPNYLTDEGIVLGTYMYNDEHPTMKGGAFWWSLEAGFHDLGDLIVNDSSAYWFSYLGPHFVDSITAEGGSPKYLLGPAPYPPSYPIGPQSAYLLTASVPTGDVDLDGDVDLSDLGVLAASYGTSGGASWTQGDFDGDGDVDLADLSSLASNYGAGEAQAFADLAQLSAVPEPSATMLVLALPIIWRRRN